MQIREVWGDFRKSSQWIERTLAQFDQTYPWEGKNLINNGEPTRPQRKDGQPTAGLRDLYCFWIDTYLDDIEKLAATWVHEATKNYKNSFGSTRDGEDWRKEVLGSGGLISEESMKFLHSAKQHPEQVSQKPRIWKQSNYDGLWLSGDNQFGSAGPF